MVKAKSTGLQGFGQIQLNHIQNIPFRQYNSLLQCEVEWFESRSDARIKDLRKVLILAQDIAEAEKITEAEALSRIQDPEDPVNQPLLIKYADRLDELKTSQYTESQFKRDVASMFINSRVPKKFLRENIEVFSDLYDIELDPENIEFTSDSTRKLPSSLINQICEFVALEKNEGVEPETPVNTEDQDLGK